MAYNPNPNGRPGQPDRNPQQGGGIGIRPRAGENSPRQETGADRNKRQTAQVPGAYQTPMSRPGNAGQGIPQHLQAQYVPQVNNGSRLPKRLPERQRPVDVTRPTGPPPGMQGIPEDMQRRAWEAHLDPKIKGQGIYDPSQDVQNNERNAYMKSLGTPENEAPYAPRPSLEGTNIGRRPDQMGGDERRVDLGGGVPPDRSLITDPIDVPLPIDPMAGYEPPANATGNEMIGFRNRDDMWDMQNKLYAQQQAGTNVQGPQMPQDYSANEAINQVGYEGLTRDQLGSFGGGMVGDAQERIDTSRFLDAQKLAEQSDIERSGSSRALNDKLMQSVTDRLNTPTGLTSEALQNQYATQFADLQDQQAQQARQIQMSNNAGRRLSSIANLSDLARNTIGFDRQRRDIISNVIADDQRRQQQEMNARIGQAQGLSGQDFAQTLQGQQFLSAENQRGLANALQKGQIDIGQARDIAQNSLANAQLGSQNQQFGAQFGLDQGRAMDQSRQYASNLGMQEAQLQAQEDQRRLQAQQDKFGMGMAGSQFNLGQEQANLQRQAENAMFERQNYNRDQGFDLQLANAEAQQANAMDPIFGQLMGQEGMQGAMGQLQGAYDQQRGDNQTMGDWLSGLISGGGAPQGGTPPIVPYVDPKAGGYGTRIKPEGELQF